MSKVIRLKLDTTYYFDRALEKADESDFPACLDNLYKALSLDSDNIVIRLEIASTYADMGLLSVALKEYYKLLADYDSIDEVYIGIMNCFMKQDRINEAVYYLNLGIKNGALDESEEIIDVGGAGDEPEKRFKVVDPRDNYDLVQFAKKLMLSGENDYARQMLEPIDETSRQYIEATNYLSLIAMSDGDGERCLAYAEKVLEKEPENVYALASAVMALDMLGRTEDRDKAVAYLDSLDLTEIRDLTKAAVCMQNIHNGVLAAKYYERAIAVLPYDRVTNLCCALAESNLGNKARAKELIVRLIKIYPDDTVVRYYAREINRAEGATAFDIMPAIPREEHDRRVEEIQSWLALRANIHAVTEALKTDEYMRELIMWVFQSDEVSLQAGIGGFLAQDEEWQLFIRELLIDPDFHYRAKKECLQQFLKYSEYKSFSLVLSDVLLYFYPKIPKNVYSVTLEDAYWSVYATLSFVDYAFDKKLNAAFRKLVSLMSEPEFREKYADAVDGLDAETLGAVLAHRAKINPIFDKPNDCCEVFGCQLTDFEAYAEMLDSVKKTKKDK